MFQWSRSSSLFFAEASEAEKVEPAVRSCDAHVLVGLHLGLLQGNFGVWVHRSDDFDAAEGEWDAALGISKHEPDLCSSCTITFALYGKPLTSSDRARGFTAQDFIITIVFVEAYPDILDLRSGSFVVAG